jgi:rare lipoprotein A (peptidoglycan hydrolase)
MRPQSILRAGAAIAPCAFLAGVAGAFAATPQAAHPAGGAQSGPSAPARAATVAARPAAGDVAIARRRLNVVAGHRALVSGHVTGTPIGQAVALQRHAGHGWHTIDREHTRPGGAFAFRFRPREAGSAVVRVRSGAANEHVGRMNVFRHAQASWYGPGLYGGRLSCGGTLTAGTLGVANKTLPCGAKVTLRHGGRTVRVPVVDRGPFAGGREFDLTAATKDRIGFSGAGSVLVAD